MNACMHTILKFYANIATALHNWHAVIYLIQYLAIFQNYCRALQLAISIHACICMQLAAVRYSHELYSKTSEHM